MAETARSDVEMEEAEAEEAESEGEQAEAEASSSDDDAEEALPARQRFFCCADPGSHGGAIWCMCRVAS